MNYSKRTVPCSLSPSARIREDDEPLLLLRTNDKYFLRHNYKNYQQHKLKASLAI